MALFVLLAQGYGQAFRRTMLTSTYASTTITEMMPGEVLIGCLQMRCRGRQANRFGPGQVVVVVVCVRDERVERSISHGTSADGSIRRRMGLATVMVVERDQLDRFLAVAVHRAHQLKGRAIGLNGRDARRGNGFKGIQEYIGLENVF